MKHVTHWINGAPYVATEAEVPADKVGAALTALRDKAVDLIDPERTGDIYDPATGQVSGTVDFASVRIMDEAVAAAKAAFAEWGTTSLTKRTQILFAFRELLNARKEELAAIITDEHGKVLSDALGEVTRGLEVVEFACGIPHLLKGGYSEGVSTGVDVYSIRQPLGVVGIISPFNFPAMVPMWFFPIAIAAGNTVILKPSEKDPSAANFIAELWKEAGLPDGVFNVVHGDKVAVDALLTHPDVKAISFVGSTADREVRLRDRHRARQARPGPRRGEEPHGGPARRRPRPGRRRGGQRRLRLGGGALHGDLRAGRRRRRRRPARRQDRRADGRRCAPVTAGAAATWARWSPACTATRSASYVDAGEAAGATLVVDGRDPVVDGDADGFWLGPTLFDNVTPDMSIYTDEIFGPVLSVVRVDSYEAALKLVNDHPYGNGTAIFTNDGGAARRYQNEVEVGMIGINVPIPVPMAYYSFGGWKASLFGDTHAHGTEGVHFFTRGKVVTSRWLDPSHGGINLGFPTHG